MPVDKNDHQRIDNVSTDRMFYDIRSVETMGLALTDRLLCPSVTMTVSLSDDMLL